jgi:hypothetical protein
LASVKEEEDIAHPAEAKDGRYGKCRGGRNAILAASIFLHKLYPASNAKRENKYTIRKWIANGWPSVVVGVHITGGEHTE